MLISVVIPTHSRPKGLGDLLRSLADQEFAGDQLEIHVVSNFKEDPSAEVTETFKSAVKNINWHYVGERGVNRARNLGLKSSRGEIVAFFDDDCVVPHRNFLDEILKAHRDHPTAIAVGGGYFAPAEAGAAEVAYNHISDVWLMRRTEDGGKCVNLVGGNVSYKRALMNANGFEFNNEIVFGGAETELHLRMFRAGAELVYLENMRVEHRARIGGLHLLRKAFAQGMASYARWNAGLHVTTRMPASAIALSLPFLTRFWKESFDHVFVLGSNHMRSQTPASRSKWGIRLLARSIYSHVRREIHAWRFSLVQRSQLVSLPLQRFYVLPVSTQCNYSCSYCPALGCKKTSVESIDSDLRKAKLYGYSEILLPCNSTFAPGIEGVIGKIEAAGLKANLLINGDANAPIDLERARRLSEKLGFHLLVGAASQYQNTVLAFLHKYYSDFTATYFHSDRRKGLKILKSLPVQLAGRMHFIFSSRGSIWNPKPSCLNIHKFLVKARQHVRGPAGYWPFERPAEFDPAVYPLLEAKWSSGTKPESPEISVIIPTYDSGPHLLKVLNSLRSQTISRERFEVLVMDDGSRDGTLEMLMAEEPMPFHLRYFYWPRDPSRKEPEFRAGLIRNLGVSQSRGELLCFLDSDILAGPDYLSLVEQMSKSYDVIQAKRDMLTQRASRRTTGFENFLGYDIYPDDPYWESFKALDSWTQTPKFWKYTCTYALSMRKDLFMKAGWFSPEFYCYGFEDVDLGYRLYKLGARFHLSETTVFHLYPERIDHNYHFDAEKRATALVQSSRVFYRNRLDPEIFNEFYPGYYQPLVVKLMKPYYFLRFQYRKRIKSGYISMRPERAAH